ncbi:hypothetical protein [Paractinoplanes brasiliensis]|nr:hypothetical protein [Actinoplanes brasiliensis]
MSVSRPCPSSCTNAYPNARELATVDANFRSTAVVAPQTYVWEPAAS